MELVFVLVSPHTPGNVGAACRALKVTGHPAPRVVAPRCDLAADEAYQFAHGSYDLLESIAVHPDLASALADCDLAVATTAKHRDLRQDYYDLDALAPLLAAKAGAVRRVAVVFGREDGGLSSEELALCPLASSIPLAVEYPSLNLAQAVMLYAHALSPLRAVAPGDADDDPVPFAPLRSRLERILDALGLESPNALRGRVIERAASLSAGDTRLVHTLCARLLNLLDRRAGADTH